MDLYLRRNLTEPVTGGNLVLRRNHTGETAVIWTKIYWKRDDLAGAQYQFLGTTKTGTKLEVPFELKGEFPIRFKIVGVTETGVESVSLLDNANTYLFTPDKTARNFDNESEKLKTASETLSAGDLVNVWLDSGDVKVRLADATDTAKQAHGFVLQDYDIGDLVNVNVAGTNSHMTGLSAGDVLYLSDATPGGVMNTMPAAAVIQRVGIALSETFMSFEPDLANYAQTIRPLFDQYADATTSGTTEEELYSNSITAATLSTNGDKLSIEYAGIFAANGNSKVLRAEIFAAEVVNETFSDNDVDWEIELTIIRVSNTVVRTQSTVTVDGVTCKVLYNEITALNLTTTDYDCTLFGRTPTQAGDLTAKMGYGLFIPAAPVVDVTDNLLFIGDSVLFGGDALAFNP